MLKPGDTFGHYRIDAVIGQGGMGRVYAAYDPRLERRVALKVISDASASTDATTRLLREARAVAALDHPNVVGIFDVGEREGEPFIVMELVSGHTLRGAIGDAAVPVATRVGHLAAVARALAAAHQRGLVHRDIKPENVMVREDGGVKVLDFGIARRASASINPTAPTEANAVATLTEVGVRVGTPLYMSPEQVRGDTVDGRADQFAWGVVAYELLTGRMPWRGGGDALAIAASILMDEPSVAALDAAGVPPAVKAVVLRALEKRPGDRFASMNEVLAALDAAAKGGAASEDRAGRPSAEAVNPGAANPGAVNPGVTAAQRYSTQEVREILVRAIEQQEQGKRDDGRLGFDDLLSAAREVGVDDETLRQASRDLRARGEGGDRALAVDDKAERDAWFRMRRRGFQRHLGAYLCTNIALIVLGFLTHGDGFPGLLIPGLFWGIGLGIHAVNVFTADDDEWNEVRSRRQRREQKRRLRDGAVNLVVDQGAALLLETGAALRKRIDSGAVGARAKVRIASDKAAAETEALAEEAEAAESGQKKRRRDRR